MCILCACVHNNRHTPRCMYVQMYACMHRHTHVCTDIFMYVVYACIYIYMHVRTNICMCVNECTYVCECTNVCLLLHILHMYVCIFMYTCVDVMCMCTYVVHVCPLCSITLGVCLLLSTSRLLSIGRLLLSVNLLIFFNYFFNDLDDRIRSWRSHKHDRYLANIFSWPGLEIIPRSVSGALGVDSRRPFFSTAAAASRSRDPAAALAARRAPGP